MSMMQAFQMNIWQIKNGSTIDSEEWEKEATQTRQTKKCAAVAYTDLQNIYIPKRVRVGAFQMISTDLSNKQNHKI